MLSIYNQKRKQKNIKNNQQGFTLVEVMIVLGIGAAIIALALIVVPTVLRNQRDGQRETAAATVFTEVSSWVTRRNGKLPEDKGDIADALADITLPFYGKVGDSSGITVDDINNGDPTTNFRVRFSKNTDLEGGSGKDVTAGVHQIDIVTGVICPAGGITDIPKRKFLKNNGKYGETTGGSGGTDLTGGVRSFAVLWGTEGNANLFCRDNT